MLNRGQIEAARQLVAFFNGYRVAENSIKLQMPEFKDGAQEFFRVRSAIGMEGYLGWQDAIDRVADKLFGERLP